MLFNKINILFFITIIYIYIYIYTIMTYGVNKTGLRPRGQTNDNFIIKQSDIDKHITNRLHYFTTLKQKLDANATKVSNNNLRREWLKNQKKMNYTNEYNRIRSELEQSKLKGLSTQSLQKRKDDLKKLGANIVDGIVD